MQRFHVTLRRVSLSIITPSLVQQCLTFETYSWLLGGAAATLLPPSPKKTRETGSTLLVRSLLHLPVTIRK